MRLLVGAAGVLFALVAPAHAGGFGLPNIPCLLFCDSKPAPPAAHAAEAKPVAAPRELHPPHASAPPAVEPKRFARPAHASKPSRFVYRPQSAVASAARPNPAPPRPSPVAVVATATPVTSPTAAPTQSAASASELISANASAPSVSGATPTSVAPDPRFVDHGSDPAVRLLAQAFSESPQPAPAAVSSPAPPPPAAKAVAAAPASTFAMVEPAQPSAFVQVTANGLVFPWWPSSFPARAAVWIVTLALIAAAAFGVAIASGRRLAA
jgi:hypothetical protein